MNCVGGITSFFKENTNPASDLDKTAIGKSGNLFLFIESEHLQKQQLYKKLQ